MEYKGSLIPVGGGKDSCVTLELLKEHKKMKKDYNKLNANYTKLKEEDSQISFGNITPNSEVLDELLNLDILNMNLIDCVNTLYNLQKKAKENK